MKIDILTLFPEMFKGPFDESILKRAQDKSLVEISIHNLRDWAIDKHGTVDDHPYGGGPGMIIRADVIDCALASLKKKESIVLLTDAGGEKFTQQKAFHYSKLNHLILIAGHYEGVDHRVHEHLADEIISIGNFVLTGGEIPIMAIVDATVRLIPGVIKAESLENESFSSFTSSSQQSISIEYPQYTRPEIYKNWIVPQTLLSGNHKDIKKWKSERTR